MLYVHDVGEIDVNVFRPKLTLALSKGELVVGAFEIPLPIYKTVVHPLWKYTHLSSIKFIIFDLFEQYV